MFVKLVFEVRDKVECLFYLSLVQVGFAFQAAFFRTQKSFESKHKFHFERQKASSWKGDQEMTSNGLFTALTLGFYGEKGTSFTSEIGGGFN